MPVFSSKEKKIIVRIINFFLIFNTVNRLKDRVERGLISVDEAEKESSHKSFLSYRKRSIIESAFNELSGQTTTKIIYKASDGFAVSSPLGRYGPVIFYYDENNFISEDELYAVAGHEAAHHFRYHLLINNGISDLYIGISTSLFVRTAILSSPEILVFAPGLLISQALVFLFLSRLLERDADCYSVKKLGTARLLRHRFERSLSRAPYNSDERKLDSITWARLFSTHPRLAERVRYLEAIEMEEERRMCGRR